MSGESGNMNRNETGLPISCYLQFRNNAILSKMGMMGCHGTAHDGQCAYQSSQRLKCDGEMGWETLIGEEERDQEGQS